MRTNRDEHGQKLNSPREDRGKFVRIVRRIWIWSQTRQQKMVVLCLEVMWVLFWPTDSLGEFISNAKRRCY